MTNLLRKYNAFTIVIVVFLYAFMVGCAGPAADIDKEDQKIVKKGDSIGILSQQIELYPDQSGVFYERGKFQYKQGRYSEAIGDLIRCVELDSTEADCWHLMADAYLDDNRSRLAIETLEDFLKLDPNRIPTLLKLAKFQTIIERYTAAHFNLNTILKQDRVHAEALFLKGLIYHYEDEPIKAVEYLQQAIQSDPDLSDGHLLLGQIFEEAGNPLARKYFENAIRVDPDNPEAKMSLANFYWMSNDYTMALLKYNDLLAEHPNFTRGYFNNGLILLEMDSLEQAHRLFERATSLEPDFIMAHYYLGETNILMENLDQAKIHLEEAARLSPTNTKIKRTLSEVTDKIESIKK